MTSTPAGDELLDLTKVIRGLLDPFVARDPLLIHGNPDHVAGHVARELYLIAYKAEFIPGQVYSYISTSGVKVNWVRDRTGSWHSSDRRTCQDHDVKIALEEGDGELT